MSMMMSRAATESQSAPLFAGALRRIARFGRALMLHWDRRAAVTSLSELDDRALRDIGLLRCQIEDAVRGRARRRGS